MKKVIFYWLPPVSYMALIFYMSSHPAPEVMPEIWNFDKGAHFLEYGILGILWFRALNTRAEKGKKITIIAFTVTFLYGISDEIHQYFIPQRTASVYDAISDGLGAWFAIWLYKRRF